MKNEVSLAVYVPGLGGQSALDKQSSAIKRWSNSRRQTLFLEPNWNSKESYADKEHRLLKELHKAAANYSKVYIIGTSAGGSMGMNLFMKLEHSDKYFRSVCGKLNGSNRIGPKYSVPHPALIPSVRESERLAGKLSNLQASRITTYAPLFDEVVPIRDMSVKGAKHLRLPLAIHSLTIWLSIRFFYRKLLR